MKTMAVDFKKLFDALHKSSDGVVRIADHSSYSSDGATYLVEIRKEQLPDHPQKAAAP